MPLFIRTFGGLEVSPAKCFRARQIAEELLFTAKLARESGKSWGLDVAVFQEAFCDLGRPVLLAAMYKKGFIYSTGLANRMIGSEEMGTLNSGVCIVSRHPIETWDFSRFHDAVGDDALADKGVIYARINKNGAKIHIFGTHTQAWQERDHAVCRGKQFNQMSEFIAAQVFKSHYLSLSSNAHS